MHRPGLQRMAVATLSFGDRVRALLVYTCSALLLMVSLVWFALERVIAAMPSHSFPELVFAGDSFSASSKSLSRSTSLSARRTPSISGSSATSHHRQRRYTLVLDLDETLVHTSTIRTSHFDLRVEVFGKRTPNVFYVLKRPFVDVFLAHISQYFYVVVYTASIRCYADAVIDLIDPNHYISKRYFRDSCIEKGGTFMKDLTFVADDLSKTIIIDNSPESYTLHEDNTIPIEAWYDDPSDDELLNFIPFLMALRCTQDVRSILCRRIAGIKRLQ